MAVTWRLPLEVKTIVQWPVATDAEHDSGPSVVTLTVPEGAGVPPNWFVTVNWTSADSPVLDGSGETLVIVVVDGSATPVADDEIVAEYEPPADAALSVVTTSVHGSSVNEAGSAPKFVLKLSVPPLVVPTTDDAVS